MSPVASRLLRTIAVLFLLISTVALGAPRRYKNAFTGVRPSAMGNAFTAVSDDANALYYNPAGLARLETWNLDILSAIIGANNALAFNFANVLDIYQGGQSSNTNDPSQVLENMRPVLTDLSGENHFARVGLNPSLVMRNFGFGLYSGVELELVPHANGLPTILDVSVLADNQARFGGAYTFFGKKLSVGATLNLHARALAIVDEFGVFRVVDIAEDDEALQREVESSFASGWGVGTDVGILFTPVELWKPTLGISINNVGDTGFTYLKLIETAETENAPSPIRQAVNVGVSVTPEWGQYYLRGAVDFREINLPVPASRKLGTGFEAGIKGNYLKGSLQLGLSEGYFTGGFEMDLFLLALRYSTHVTDMGFVPTDRAERRHLIQLKVLL